MKRTFPLIITGLAGLVLIVSFFIPAAQPAGEAATVWFDVLAAMAFVLGSANLLRLHLQKVSDKKPGWGFSIVTLVTFIGMLSLGLFKVAAPPEQSLEYYGETFAKFPLEQLPEYRVTGTIPTRADQHSVPASVRRQIRQDGDEIVFQGWMNLNQKADLETYDESLLWRATAEQLFEASQPPADLNGKLHYYTDHGSLSFLGFMTEQEQQALEQLLPVSPETTSAMTKLVEDARRPTSIAVKEFPEEFVIPESAAEYVQKTDTELTVLGPMSTGRRRGQDGLREQLARNWAHFEYARPLTETQRQNLLSEIESRGNALNSKQVEAFNAFWDADWKPEALIIAINSGGAGVQVSKTWQELLTEVQAGTQDPEPLKPAPQAVVLTEAQEQVVRDFVAQPEITVAQLTEQLQAAGEMTPGQLAAIPAFFTQLPTYASQLQKLTMRLLENGPLAVEQRNFLLEGIGKEFQWRQTVGRLFVASHQVKYPWSGNYSVQGSPFWWLYQYVFLPLAATTFAMLAFYVASASFRAFRAKNLEATLLLGTAFIILLGRTFAGFLVTSWIPDSLSALRIDQMTVYIMMTLVTAGNRAIMIGIALGIASTSIKVLLGIDRSYLGAGDD